MGAIINFSLNLDNLDKSKIVKGKKGNYYPLTLSVNDEVSQYGDNVSVFTTQTQEEREAKAKRTYVANGKVVWTDGNIEAAPKEQKQVAQTQEVDDFPF
jgi:hypothetical protein